MTKKEGVLQQKQDSWHPWELFKKSLKKLEFLVVQIPEIQITCFHRQIKSDPERTNVSLGLHTFYLLLETNYWKRGLPVLEGRYHLESALVLPLSLFMTKENGIEAWGTAHTKKEMHYQ